MKNLWLRIQIFIELFMQKDGAIKKKIGEKRKLYRKIYIFKDTNNNWGHFF